ncbi:putative protein NAP1 [Camellia lanceoleosa]|uniref:Uncharacterized protein n=1 Tax=Camellia lanceoleosa TaxID=1840588 RepID=A0ACC0FXT7_9ERIC|nr:putative protein NAP1 [Camellia lanceoleosa]
MLFQVLEAVGPIIFLSTDTRKLRNEGFLSPFHPRYPDILTNSAHPMRAQDLANVTSYREWVLLGYLVCPDELLRVTSIDIALVNSRQFFFVSLYVLLHEDYQLYVLPRILKSKKMAKFGRTKQKEADLEYIVAKQVEKMIRDLKNAKKDLGKNCVALYEASSGDGSLNDDGKSTRSGDLSSSGSSAGEMLKCSPSSLDLLTNANPQQHKPLCAMGSSP